MPSRFEPVAVVLICALAAIMLSITEVVIRDDAANDQQKVSKTVHIATNPDKWWIGSTEDEVLRVQGAPSRYCYETVNGIESIEWLYNGQDEGNNVDTIHFDENSQGVVSYQNKTGSLKVGKF